MPTLKPGWSNASKRHNRRYHEDTEWDLEDEVQQQTQRLSTMDDPFFPYYDDTPEDY